MTMRFTVESWSPEFGAPVDMEIELPDKQVKVDLGVELPIAEWRAVAPRVAPSPSLHFVDGVRRIDARLWAEEADGVRLSLCASYAAGAAVCDGTARVVAAEVARCAIGPSALGPIATSAGTYDAIPAATDALPDLINHLQVALQQLEAKVTQSLGPLPLLVVDGSLTGREHVPNVIGYLKSHKVAYIQGELGKIVTGLQPGQRTPVFLVETSWQRYSWYLRLPGGHGHPWAGIARCEASATFPPAEAIRLADLAAATLPRFASTSYKDPRAPQNLYPVAGLERELKRRLGDQGLLHRGLLVASRSMA